MTMDNVLNGPIDLGSKESLPKLDAIVRDESLSIELRALAAANYDKIMGIDGDTERMSDEDIVSEFIWSLDN